MSIVVSEDCPSSKNEFGIHCDHWYDDEGCHWCGTEEPNLIIIEVPEQGAEPPSGAEARAVAKNFGWKRRGGKDLCPEHADLSDSLPVPVNGAIGPVSADDQRG